MFGGMAQRMAYALQLHQDLDHDPKRSAGNEKSELTFTDREIRRRTMWSCFLLDRFSSSGTDRPAFVGPEYIRAQLPIREKLFNMEITGPTEDLQGNVPNPVDPETGQVADARENMGVAAYTIRLVAVWGDVINYMNLGGKQRDQKPMWDEDSAFQRLRKAADDWKDTLPAALKYTPRESGQPCERQDRQPISVHAHRLQPNHAVHEPIRFTDSRPTSSLPQGNARRIH